MQLARSLMVSMSLAACAACAACATGGGSSAAPRPPAPPPIPACVGDAARATRGMVHGVITDTTGAPIAGAAIVATSPSLHGEEVAISDDAGAYTVPLPPGTYMLTYYYGDDTIERVGIPVGLGCDTPADVRIDLTKTPAHEEIRIRG